MSSRPATQPLYRISPGRAGTEDGGLAQTEPGVDYLPPEAVRQLAHTLPTRAE